MFILTFFCKFKNNEKIKRSDKILLASQSAPPLFTSTFFEELRLLIAKDGKHGKVPVLLFGYLSIIKPHLCLGKYVHNEAVERNEEL